MRNNNTSTRRVRPASSFPCRVLAILAACAALTAQGQDLTYSYAAFTDTSRQYHTATLLADGRVLVAGGKSHFEWHRDLLTHTEVYDPSTDAWTRAGALNFIRSQHCAVLLRGGEVLVTGGESYAGSIATSERFDPRTGEWSSAAPLATPRGYFTATVLPDGRVLAVGGRNYDAVGSRTSDLDTVEVYDPVADRWTAAPPLTTARWSHTATLLRDGRVLVVGGWYNGNALTTAEVLDPATNRWSAVAAMPVALAGHAATLLANGKVLLTGGDAGGAATLLFDPQANAWTSGAAGIEPLRSPTMSLMPDGRVLVIGAGGSMTYPLPAWYVFDPDKGSWTKRAGGSTRDGHSATLLANGTALVMGGALVYPNGGAAAEVAYSLSPTWTTAGTLQTWRIRPSLTLLPTGKVLIAGGTNDQVMETFDPATGQVVAAGLMPRSRIEFQAKLLRNGKVLFAGGHSPNDYVREADLYDPGTGQWSPAGALRQARQGHSTTLLADGRVMIAGGRTDSEPLGSIELFDPATSTWSNAGELLVPRYDHSATLLPDGRVLVAGGQAPGSRFHSGEIYDPRTGAVTNTPGGMFTARSGHDALLLSDGRVMTFLGELPQMAQLADLYDPVRNEWSTGMWIEQSRSNARATLLADGDVLVTGGLTGSSIFEGQAEIASRVAIQARKAGTMAVPRGQHSTIRLLDGRVLVVGGSGAAGVTTVVELFDPGRYATQDRRPLVTAVPAVVTPGAAITIGGARLTGDSEASGGGARHSVANVPIVQLQRMDDGATTFLTGVAWNGTSFTAAPLRTAAPGWYTLRVTAGGITSDAVPLALDGAGVGPYPSSVSLAVPPGAPIVAAGAPGALVATVSGSGATGSVTFYDGGFPLGGCRDVALAGVSATCLTGALAAGPHVLSARYSGDAVHFPSRAAGVTVQVQPPRSDCSVQLDQADYPMNEGVPYGIAVTTLTGFCPNPVDWSYDLHDIDAGPYAYGFSYALPPSWATNPAMHAQTFTVSSVPETKPRSFRLDLFGVANAKLGTPASMTVHIADTDAAPVKMPVGGRIVANPYGPVTVTGANLAGDRLVDLTAHVTIELGALAGDPAAAFEIAFDAFELGKGNVLEIRAGAAGQTVVLRNTGPKEATIEGYVKASWPQLPVSPFTLHLASPAGITVLAGGFVESWSRLVMDALGATWFEGQPLRNDGTLLGWDGLTLMGASIGGGGAHVAGALNVVSFGNVNNPRRGSFYLENGLRVFPAGYEVPITIAAYGSAPQFINLSVTGDATLTMPSAWPAGVGLPPNHRPVAPGEAIPAYAPPTYGGGSMILQVVNRLTLLPGGSGDLVFPGALVLKAGGTLDAGSVTINNGWTTNGQAFQGVFLESPHIVNRGGPIRVFTNDRNWVNFGSFPRARVDTSQLVGGAQTSFRLANGIAPHLNTYSTLIETSARGECWTCLVNPMAFP